MVFIEFHYSNKNFVSVVNNHFTFDKYQSNSHVNGKYGSNILETKLKEEKFQEDMKNIISHISIMAECPSLSPSPSPSPSPHASCHP